MASHVDTFTNGTSTPDISIPASRLLVHLEECKQCLTSVKKSINSSPSCSLPASAILAHLENCTHCLETVVGCIKDGTRMTPASSASNSFISFQSADPGPTLVAHDALPSCLRCGDLFSPDDQDDTCQAHAPDGLLLPNYRDEYWRNNVAAAQVNGVVELTGSKYALADYTWSCCSKSANDWGCRDVEHTTSQEQINNERQAVTGPRAIVETTTLQEAFCDAISREKGPHICITCGAIYLEFFNTGQSCGGKNHVKGVRVPNFRHKIWKGKRVKEDIGNYVDHPDYAEGFKWSKCQHHAFQEGCRFRPHVNKFANLNPRPGKQMFHPGEIPSSAV
ncbi:uncharacterized protein PAC_09355 [Phialocephala subalpina]|uniref:Uncharacterized protein n=1 Tax=Phialocephala subalpina TaxID=576137 RepID=A0A1L7X364_9HELO|nr:uncharacterized protein PAC_09355 [Phialocephala subalpina]